MIGLIVTGHGKFASGMEEALTEIASKPQYFAAVDYELSESPESLSKRLEAAVDDLKDCGSVLFLCDLAGGTPFKESAELAAARGFETVAGTNLGMLIEVNLMREFMDDVQKLARQAVTVGKDQVLRLNPKSSEN